MKRKFIIQILLTFPLFLISSISTFSQSEQKEPQRFSYHIWGNVTDENSNPMINITVCFFPAERPINGRVPCTKTDQSGNYAFTVKDVPDKYIVSASTGDWFIPIGKQQKKERYKSSEPISFGAEDVCRKIDFQLPPN